MTVQPEPTGESTYPLDVELVSHLIHRRNIRYGFKEDGVPRDPTTVTMLVISELSEAFEELRKGYEASYRYFSCKPCQRDIHMQPDVLEVHSNEKAFAYRVFACPYCAGPVKPEGFGVEFADALIRLLDAGPEFGLDYDYLVRHKMAYNDTREPKHGKTM